MIVDELADDVAFDARRKGQLFNLAHALYLIKSVGGRNLQ